MTSRRFTFVAKQRAYGFPMVVPLNSVTWIVMGAQVTFRFSAVQFNPKLGNTRRGSPHVASHQKHGAIRTRHDAPPLDVKRERRQGRRFPGGAIVIEQRNSWFHDPLLHWVSGHGIGR